MKFQTHAMKNEQKFNFRKNKNRKTLAFSVVRIVLNIKILSLTMAHNNPTVAKLDKIFSDIIHNGNKKHCSILGKGDVEFFAKKNKEN